MLVKHLKHYSPDEHTPKILEQHTEPDSKPKKSPRIPENISLIFSSLELILLLATLVLTTKILNYSAEQRITNTAKGAVEQKTIYTFQQGLDGYLGVMDSQLRSDHVRQNYGSSPILKVQADNWILGVIRFDLSAIPPSSIVKNARLELYLDSKNDNKRFSLGLYKLLRPWIEEQVTWMQAMEETSWGKEGANKIGVDRDGTAIAQTVVEQTGQWYSLDITQTIQDWVSARQNNYGFVLRGLDRKPDTEFNFNSSNYPTLELRPRLTVLLEATLPTNLTPTQSVPTSTNTPTPQNSSPTPTNTQPTPTRNSTPTPTRIITQTPTITLTQTPTPTGQASGSWWKPTANQPVHFHWQLTDDFVYPRDVVSGMTVYDIDGEKASVATVASLHALGAKVICYFDAGVWENYRSDAGKFPGSAAHGIAYTGDPQYANVSIIGKADSGWNGSYWMNTSRIDILQPLMEWRIKNWCADKGFDAIEPDETENQDYYGSNVTGFAIPLANTIAYNKMIADLAHKYNLSAGLKGNTGELTDQVQYYDWNLNEECWQYNECSNIRDTFIKANKMAINVEYSKTPDCATANSWHLNSQKRDLDLVGPTNSKYSVMNCIPYSQNSW